MADEIPTLKGAKLFPYPDGYPSDGKDVSITKFNGNFVISHPDNVPHVLIDGKWEEVRDK